MVVDRHAEKVLLAHGAACFFIKLRTNSVSDLINASTTTIDTIIHTLQNTHQFDPSQIKTDAESLEHWGKDWTKHFTPDAAAIVFPKTTEQVQSIVLLANEHNVVLTPSGGRTGLSAGAVASNGEIVVSMDKMNQIGTVFSCRSHG